MNYNNLEFEEWKGEMKDVHVWVVSVVGNCICMDVGDPGLEVWFLVNFYMGLADDNVFVRCLTQDGISFYPFHWIGDMQFKFVGDSDGYGGGRVWLAIGEYVREFAGRVNGL